MSAALFTHAYECPLSLAQTFKYAAGAAVAAGLVVVTLGAATMQNEMPAFFEPDRKYLRAKAAPAPGAQNAYQLSEQVIRNDGTVAKVVSEKVLQGDVTKAQALKWLDEKEQGWIREKRKQRSRPFDGDDHFPPLSFDNTVSMGLEKPVDLSPPLQVKTPRRNSKTGDKPA